MSEETEQETTGGRGFLLFNTKKQNLAQGEVTTGGATSKAAHHLQVLRRCLRPVDLHWVHLLKLRSNHDSLDHDPSVGQEMSTKRHGQHRVVHGVSGLIRGTDETRKHYLSTCLRRRRLIRLVNSLKRSAAAGERVKYLRYVKVLV